MSRPRAWWEELPEDRVQYDTLINFLPMYEQVAIFHQARRNFETCEPELIRSVSNIIATTRGIPHPVGDIIAFMAFGYGFDVRLTLRSVHAQITHTHIEASYTMTVADVTEMFAVETNTPDVDFYTTDFTNPELDVLADDILLCALPRSRPVVVTSCGTRELFRVCGGGVKVRVGFRGTKFKRIPERFSNCSCGAGACVCLMDNEHALRRV